MSRYAVILVPTTSHAIQAERVLKRAGLDAKLIPTPRHLSSDCGSAVRIAASDRETCAATQRPERAGMTRSWLVALPRVRALASSARSAPHVWQRLPQFAPSACFSPTTRWAASRRASSARLRCGRREGGTGTFGASSHGSNRSLVRSSPQTPRQRDARGARTATHGDRAEDGERRCPYRARN